MCAPKDELDLDGEDGGDVQTQERNHVPDGNGLVGHREGKVVLVVLVVGPDRCG